MGVRCDDGPDHCGAGGPGIRSLASVAGEHVGLAGTLLLTL